MIRGRIVLASASPRRSELLRQAGVACEVRPVDLDESVRPGESPEAYVRRLAEAKARAAWARRPAGTSEPVLAADTTVVLDGRVYGKPGDAVEAREMLGRLAGRTHEVHTAVAVVHAGGADSRVCTSRVTMRAIEPRELDWYCSSDEPYDKAGGYAIQGRAAVFVSRLDGSYSGVMGLPLCETWELLRAVPGLSEGAQR
ncbi:MAG: Maf family protein [Steroidobacteraceae bacterium]